MKRMPAIRIGQLVGVGFGLTLFLALLVGLGGRIAYEISQRQSEIIQRRGEVDSLTLELEILAIQRTDVLRRYLETESATFLVAYRDAEVAYDEVFDQLATLLRTPEELEAWQEVAAAETALDEKAQEVFRLYDGNFPGSARFLWTSEGIDTQNSLIQAINSLRQIQSETSQRIINQARQTENTAIIVVTIFFGLALLVGIMASLLITRSITRPLSNLVQRTAEIGSDLSIRVNPSGPEEIAFLGETINDMAAKLFAFRQALQEHNARLEHELTLASQIQASFFPETLPRLPGLELAAFWQPAREMGGDFYTSVSLRNGQLGIVVCDVSGKGAPAAMAGALAVGLLEAYAPSHTEPETLLARLNQDLHTRFISNYINVACCYAILDTSTFRMTVANAGCVYPYLRRGNELREIDVVGIPLGMWPEFNYQAQSISLCPGDMILFSSDGLVEARNEQGELFGFERLEAELRNLPAGINAHGTVERMVKAALTFTGQAELHDDLTVLVLNVLDQVKDDRDCL